MDAQPRDCCPICTYQYSTPDKMPKIFPCCHTFCSPCIDSIIASTPTSQDTYVKCPICRQKVIIPRNGVNGFFDNYFKSAPENCMSCDVCGKSDQSRYDSCAQCSSVLCISCLSCHHHNDDPTDQDSDDDDEESNSNMRFARRMRNTFRGTVNSALVAHTRTSFRCNNFDRISKIIPTEKNECWVLTNRPFVTKFNLSGQEKFKKYVDSVVQDIAYLSDGTLVLAFSNGEILLLTKSQELRNITTLPNVPTSVYAYEDGRLLVATAPFSDNVDVSSNFSNHPNYGRLIISDHTMKSFRRVNDINEEQLGDISSMTVNLKADQIILCDTKKKCVLFLKDKKVVKYKGNRQLPRIEQTEDAISIRPSYAFQPRSVSSDDIGNVFVLDTGTNIIHVLDQNASLISVVLALDLNGRINCFNVDRRNLWVGYISSGLIRIYNIDTVFNFSAQDDNSGSHANSGILSLLNDRLSSAFSLEDLGRLGVMRISMNPSSMDDGTPQLGEVSRPTQNVGRPEPRPRDVFIRNTF